jgi:hypothetical protein
VKRRISEIGLNPRCYSGHSLRTGFVTEAARLGVPKWRIKAQTGHLSDSALERYIRDGELQSTDVLKMFLAPGGGQPMSASNEFGRSYGVLSPAAPK